ncbi:hypothetical protein M2116_000806 [Aurantimicrobium minutum]|uniref:hypothetical protein n=1 Tax=Aurantimicrobium minutum TaxID=708131 RepID=UPI0024073CBD|nr:hypothetical protein [Aurantimicrobium minutum]MDF9809856.1 hypothetical protein [Aurantimicrobium minutum]
MGNHHEIIQEAPVNWWLISLNFVQLLAWVVAIWLGVRTLAERGKPGGYFQVAAQYNGTEWIATFIKVVITNVGKKPLIVLAVGRKYSENSLSAELLKSPPKRQITIGLPVNLTEMDFTLDPGETKVFQLASIEGEMPDTELKIPLVVWYVKTRRTFGLFGTERLVKAELAIKRLENLKF